MIVIRLKHGEEKSAQNRTEFTAIQADVKPWDLEFFRLVKYPQAGISFRC